MPHKKIQPLWGGLASQGFPAPEVHQGPGVLLHLAAVGAKQYTSSKVATAREEKTMGSHGMVSSQEVLPTPLASPTAHLPAGNLG